MNTQLPFRRSISIAFALSSIVCVAIAISSIAGFIQRESGLYSESGSVLVSLGGDAANLILVVPAILCSVLLSKRGSLIGLLLLPGGLFYALYAYIPYLIGARFNSFLLVYVLIATLSAFALAAVLASVDIDAIQQRLAAIPTRGIGIAVTAMGVVAYIGLAVVFVGSLSQPVPGAAVRGHWVADWALGTPVLVAGGVLMWRRARAGYLAGAALLLVSALGGIAFAAAAIVDNALTNLHTDPSAIVIHLVIAMINIGLLWLFASRMATSLPHHQY